MRKGALWCVVAACALSACGGGGGGGGNSSAPVTPNAAPTANSTAGPASVATALPVPANSSSPLVIDSSVAGFGVQLSLPITYADPATTLGVTAGTIPPAGGSALQSVRRIQAATLGVTGLLYVGVLPTGAVELGPLSLTITLPASVTVASGDQFYLGFYDGSASSAAYEPDIAGPVSAANGTLVFGVASGMPSFNFQQLIQYVFALYRVAAGQTPPPKVVVAPAALSLLGLGVTQTFTVSESGYTGSFTATSDATSVATVSAQNSGGSTWTVTSVATGATTIVVSDSKGNAAIVPVAVTVTNIPVQ